MSVIGKTMFSLLIRLTCHALYMYKYHLVRVFVYHIFSKHIAKVCSVTGFKTWTRSNFASVETARFGHCVCAENTTICVAENLYSSVKVYFAVNSIRIT